MNRRDIQELRVHVGYPAITIIMPCNKDNIKLKFIELVESIDSKEPLLERIKDQFDMMFAALTCPLEKFKIGLFVSKHSARLYVVPFDVPDIALCDKVFALDHISAQLNRLQRYWVVDCDAKELALFEGIAKDLLAVETSHIQCDISDDNFKRLCGLNEYLEQDNLPICLVGTPESLKTCLAQSPFRDRVVVRVTEMNDVWSSMQRYFKEKANLHIAHLESESKVVVSDIDEIIAAARQGHVRTLLVEEGYDLRGCEEGVSRHILHKEECPVGYEAISLVDSIIEFVRSKGGTVVIVPDASLKQYDRMAALVVEL